MTLRLQILDAGGHFGRRLPLIRRTLLEAIEHVVEVGDLADVDIVVHPLDSGADQFCVSAFTMGPHNIHIGIERSQLSSEDLELDLFRVAVHEMHHALRWRHRGRHWTVEEMVVLEGLAMLADHAAAGPQEDHDRPLSDLPAALSQFAAVRHERIEGNRHWLYSPEPTQPGGLDIVYSLGQTLMRAALIRLDLDPWSAAGRNAAQLVEAGLAALSDELEIIPGVRKRA